MDIKKIGDNVNMHLFTNNQYEKSLTRLLMMIADDSSSARLLKMPYNYAVLLKPEYYSPTYFSAVARLQLD